MWSLVSIRMARRYRNNRERYNDRGGMADVYLLSVMAAKIHRNNSKHSEDQSDITLKITINCCDKMNEYKNCMSISNMQEQEECKLRCNDIKCDV